MHALADYAVEYGDRGLRALGGRREAERWLSQQDGGLDVAALRHALEDRAQLP
jgi:LAO/AO transport system kinase